MHTRSEAKKQMATPPYTATSELELEWLQELFFLFTEREIL